MIRDGVFLTAAAILTPRPSPPGPGSLLRNPIRHRRRHPMTRKSRNSAPTTGGRTSSCRRAIFEAGLAVLHALGRDNHPDVANYIGFASRKLGRYHDAKVWYERALAADPQHVRTWQYYGMWHLEQGNRLKAQDHLEQIRIICRDNPCKEFNDLKDALDGNMTY